MSISLTELEDDVYDMIGKIEEDLPRPKVRAFLNRAYWQLTKTLKFRETDQLFSFSTVQGVNYYLFESYVGDFDAIRRVTITDTANLSNIAMPVIQTEYENLLDDADTTNLTSAIPTRYARYKNYITFNHIPQAQYTITVLYRKSLGNIDTAGPGIPEEWHECLIYGAASRAWFEGGAYNKAQIADAKQANLIQTLISTEVKEEVDYSRSAMRPIRRRYP